MFLGRGSSFLLVPVDATHVYCYADQHRDQPSAEGETATPDRLRTLFGDYASPVQHALESVPSDAAIAGLPIEDVVPPRWGGGRVVLIGDAAHAMSPDPASGTALALEDALVLAELLERRVPSGDLVKQLTRRRGPRVAWGDPANRAARPHACAAAGRAQSVSCACWAPACTAATIRPHF